MDYTDEQYAVMEKLSKGLRFCQLTESEQEVVIYLESRDIVQPRAQIAEDYKTLNEEGKRALANHQHEVRVAAIQTRKELDALQEKESIRQENVRREKAEKQEQLQQAAADKRERKAEKRADRVFQIFLTLLSSALSFIAGILAEHFASIVDFIAELFG